MRIFTPVSMDATEMKLLNGGLVRRRMSLIALMWIGVSTQAQWPTSTATTNALIINYGFEANAVVFENGSVVFSHGFDRWQYLTKFDSRGYAVWPNPILINSQDSCNGGNWPMVSDGAHGLVMLLGDRRGATFDSMGYAVTNSIWMQHIDSSGLEQWGAGIRVAPPDSTAKFVWITTDGARGAICVTLESSWNFPSARNFSRLRARRVSREGQVRWVRTLDSLASIDLHIRVNKVSRAGMYIYIDGERYFQPQVQTDLTRIIDTSGTVPNFSPWLGYFENVTWRDSVLFSASSEAPRLSRIRKIGPSGDILWNTPFALPDSGCQGSVFSNNSTIPDGAGGVFALYLCRDSVFHIDELGNCTRPVLPEAGGIRGYAFCDGSGGLVIAGTQGRAQRYDRLGEPLWGESGITYRSDPENAYIDDYWGDNNGGIIATFWSTTGGLCVQHTGRYGSPGVVPVGQRPALPQGMALSQNFPNPFNPSTRIRYIVTSRRHVSVEVYDLLGRRVQQLVDEVKETGSYEIEWNAQGIASGVYLCLMKTGQKTVDTKKMVLVH